MTAEIDEIYNGIVETDVDLINGLLQETLPAEYSNHDIVKHFAKYLESDKAAPSQLIKLVSEIIEMGFDPSDQRHPFKPAFIVNGSRSLDISDLSEKTVKIIERIQSATSIPLLKAILSDILWLRKMGIAYAWTAIEQYCKVIGNVTANKPAELSYFVGYLRRAAILAMKLNAPEKQKIVRETYIAAMKLDLPEPESALRLRFFEDFIGTSIFDFNDANDWLVRAKKLSEESKKSHDYEKVRGYLQCAKKLASDLKDDSEHSNIRNLENYSYVEELAAVKNSGARPMILQDYYIRAIEALKRIDDPKNEIAALHKELTLMQPSIAEDFKMFSSSTDITDEIHTLSRDSQQYSDNKLLAFIGSLTKPPSKKSIVADAERLTKQFPLKYLIGQVSLGTQGNVIYRSHTTDDRDSSALELASFEHVSYHVAITGSKIATMLHREWSERISDAAIWTLVSVNPLIPGDRQTLFYKALMHGLKSDFAAAVHILVPQLEEILRSILRANGAIVGFLKSNQVEDQIDMNEIFRNENFSKIFGDDWHFLLKCIYVERGCLNYRNKMAHGFLDNQESFGSSAAFIWANIVLILVLAASGRKPFYCFHSEPNESANMNE